MVVNAGGAVTGILRASDIDGDALRYYIVDPQRKGDVGRGNASTTPGEFEFIYTADATATGLDSFTFKACDGITCSEPATVSITIGSEPVSGEMVIGLAEELSSAAVSPVAVAAPSNLDATTADLDYSKPFGVFYFDVHDIPAAANLETGTVVVIQLPAASVISPDAVIRKLDVTGTWRTLQSEPSATVSTGVIDPVANTLTLILRDNDMFDTNPQLGVIRDPVAIAVSKAVDPSVQDLQATVVGDVPDNTTEPAPVVVAEPVVVDESQQIDVTTPVTSSSGGGSGGGGGVFNPLLLACLGLLLLVRRKAC
jgi:hypothetical protein